MDSETEFRGVIDLNVNGVEHRALLSTLTKHENSLLAEMFTGQHPVYKDKDGRYFLEANGSTFHAILHYLRYDEFPYHGVQHYSTGLFGGGGCGFGGGARAGGVYGCSFSDADLRAIYADAVNLGLSSLVQQLDQFQAILAERKIKQYRKSVNCYDEVLNKILSGIPSEVFLYETMYTLRLDQDFQTTHEDKCCEHDCKTMIYSGFRPSNTQSVDDTVKAPCEVTLTLLSSLVKDLQQLGYYVRGLVSSCAFSCKKEMRQSRFFSFSNQVKNCCGEQMLLLIFKFGSDPNVFYPKQPVFGQSKGFDFGQTNVQKGQGLFGSAPAFGSAQSSNGQGSSFGSAQNNSAFGSAQPSNGQGGLFGSAPNNSAFGSSQGTQSAFGGFGQGQPSTNTVSFGSTQQQGFSFGSPAPQASGFGSQQSQGFGFGSEQSQGSGFGSEQPQGSGFGSQPSQGSGFGSQQTQGFSFGGQQSQGASSGTQQQQGSSFGSQPSHGLSFGSQQKQGLSFGGRASEGSKQPEDASLGLGQSKANNKASASGFRLLSSASQSQNVFGNVKSNIGSSSSFGKSTQNPPATRFGLTPNSSVPTEVPRQSTTGTPFGLQSTGKTDSTTSKAPSFSFGSAFGSSTTTSTSSGNSGTFSTIPTQAVPSSGFSFLPNQQVSPSKKPGPVFGGSATFGSPFKMSDSPRLGFTLGGGVVVGGGSGASGDGVKSENGSQVKPADVSEADDSTQDESENEEDAS